MSDTISEVPRLPLDQIHHHPANPRIDAVADDELVASIQAMGVLDPLMVAPAVDADGWVLIDGHRRDNAARRAGLTEVPVNPRYDLVTEAQQIEVMVVTGLKKELLTPVEEAKGYEQMALLGMDEAAIAASTGFPVRRVRERMRINDTSDLVRHALHTGQASLADLAVLQEFVDDETELKVLEGSLGTPNFAQQVYAARGRRERRARHQALIADFEALGARRTRAVAGAPGLVADDETGEKYLGARRIEYLTQPLQDVSAHPDCLIYVVVDWSDYTDPYLACRDQTAHPETAAPADPVAQESDWEKRRAERAELNAARRAAHLARVDWLTGHFAAMFPARSHGDLAAAARVGLPLLLIDDREAVDSGTLCAALGLGTDLGYGDARDALEAAASDYTTAKPTTALQGLATWLAVVIGDQLDEGYPEHVDDLMQLGYQLSLWDWLKKAGYRSSDVDQALVHALEVRHTELTRQAENLDEAG